MIHRHCCSMLSYTLQYISSMFYKCFWNIWLQTLLSCFDKKSKLLPDISQIYSINIIRTYLNCIFQHIKFKFYKNSRNFEQTSTDIYIPINVSQTFLQYMVINIIVYFIKVLQMFLKCLIANIEFTLKPHICLWKHFTDIAQIYLYRHYIYTSEKHQIL